MSSNSENSENNVNNINNCIDIFLNIIRYYTDEPKFSLPLSLNKKLLVHIINQAEKINIDLLPKYINFKVYTCLMDFSIDNKQPLRNFEIYDNIIIKKLT
jgi:hypothetical protein